MVANTPVGKTVELTVVRSGKVEPVRVVIGNLAGFSIAQASNESRPAGRLGLALQQLTRDLARRLGVPAESGVVVTDVRPDSPAAEAGVTAGDVVREINRLPVESLQDVGKGLSRSTGDQSHVLLRLERDGAGRYVVLNVG
jgi:serine protease Do